MFREKFLGLDYAGKKYLGLGTIVRFAKEANKKTGPRLGRKLFPGPKTSSRLQ